MQGCIYHQVWLNHHGSAVKWLLYDGFLNKNMLHQTIAHSIPASQIEAIKEALLQFNSIGIHLQSLILLDPIICPKVSLSLYNARGPNIIALMNYKNTSSSESKSRHMIVITKDGLTAQIPTISCLWEPLTYPLLFPHATLGQGVQDSKRLDYIVNPTDLHADAPT